jgi:hypothetical protein
MLYKRVIYDKVIMLLSNHKGSIFWQFLDTDLYLNWEWVF